MRTFAAKYNINIAINKRICDLSPGKIIYLYDFSVDGAVFVDSSGRLRSLEAGWVWFIGYDLRAEMINENGISSMPDVNSPRFHDELEHKANVMSIEKINGFINKNKHRWRYVTN